MEENSKKNRWIWRNLLAALIVIVALVLIAQVVLAIVTRHNRLLNVPDFTQMTVKNAESLAHRRNVRVEVTDSVFVKNIDRGLVYSQEPAAGSKVKKNRRIFLTINATTVKKVAMPSLVGFSLRQAKTELYSKGLQVGRLSYTQDIATNNVLAQKYGGVQIAPGTQIDVDSKIDLLLGLNYDDNETYIPYLLGYTADLAKETIIDNSLNIGNITYDETVTNYEDSLKAMVYQQSPVYTNRVSYPLGAMVDIKLTLDQAKIKITASETPEEIIEEDNE